MLLSLDVSSQQAECVQATEADLLFAQVLKSVFGQETSTALQPSICATYFSRRCIELYMQLLQLLLLGKFWFL